MGPNANRFSVAAGVREGAAAAVTAGAAWASCDGCDPPWLSWETWLAQGAVTGYDGF